MLILCNFLGGLYTGINLERLIQKDGLTKEGEKNVTVL